MEEMRRVENPSIARHNNSIDQTNRFQIYFVETNNILKCLLSCNCLLQIKAENISVSA